MWGKIEKAIQEAFAPKAKENQNTTPVMGFMETTARAHTEKHTRPNAPFDGD